MAFAQASSSRSAEADEDALLVTITLFDVFDCECEDEVCLFMIADADTFEPRCRQEGLLKFKPESNKTATEVLSLKQSWLLCLTVAKSQGKEGSSPFS